MKLRKVLALILLFLSLIITSCISTKVTTTTTKSEDVTTSDLATTTNNTTTTTKDKETIVLRDLHDSPAPSEDTRARADYSKSTIIIDNQNKEFTYTNGILKTANDKTSFTGDDFIVGTNSGFSAKWTPNITKAGLYKIYIMWPDFENTEYLKVEVAYEGGNNLDQTKIFNQVYNAGYWVYVGNYYLAEGTNNYVKVTGQTGKTIVVDAVMFDLSVQLAEPFTEEPLRVMDVDLNTTEVRVVRTKDGNFHLTVDGEIFFGKGIADVGELEKMVEAGVNVARIYSTAPLADGLLDRAQELGVKIVVGLWLNHETATFTYKDNPEQVRAQYEALTKEVDKYKGHPAILAWAIGNEVDKSTSLSPKHIYDAMNELAKYIHEADPLHPTIACIAGANQVKMVSINRYAPHIDIMMVNTYKQIPTAHDKITHAWTGAYMIGEYAVDQPMETTTTTSWGAIIEPNDFVKMNAYSERYTKYILANQNNNCVGSFAFKDQGAFRVSHTWYNLIINGKKTPTYYAMKAAWTGEPIEINIPYIKNVTIDGKSQTASVILEKNTNYLIQVDVENAADENLTYTYELRKNADISSNTVPSVLNKVVFTDVQGKPNEKYIKTPGDPGNYRLYVYVTNDRDQISSFSFPFQVIGEPFVLEDQPAVMIFDTYSEGFTTISGTWKRSSNRPYNNKLTLYSSDNNAIAEFKPTNLNPGKYQVYFYNLSEGMYQHDEAEVAFEVYFNNNQKETYSYHITQTPEGWNLIDEFEFTGTGNEFVRIMKQSQTGKVLRATAIAFLPVDDD